MGQNIDFLKTVETDKTDRLREKLVMWRFQKIYLCIYVP